MKTCYRCKQRKDHSEFGKNASKGDGLQTECRGCRKTIKGACGGATHVAYEMKSRRKHAARYLVGKAKARALARGILFDLVPEDITIPEICPILGIPVTLFEENNRDGSPSLDRLRPAQGYVKSNVWVISWRANVLKRDASPEELLAFARWSMSTFAERV
jgi:hypothetical protein